MIRRADAIVSLGLVLAVVAIYAHAGGFAFLEWDDGVYVTENPLVRTGLSWAAARGAFTHLVGANWHPLTVLSHALDVTLFGLDPGAHHWVNVAFHAANALLLYAFLRQATGEIARAAFVAALFAVHPLHVESVAWISERKDVLSTFFGLCMLLSYRRWTARPTLAGYVAVAGLLLAGLLAKPMLVTAPLWLLLADVWPLRRIPGEALVLRARSLGLWWPFVREKLPLFGIASVFAVVALGAQTAHGAVREGVPLLRRAANAVVAAGRYLIDAVWPVDLAFFYPYPASIAPLALALSGVVLALGTALAVRAAARRPELFVGWLWYVVTLLPVAGLVPIGLQARADRYTYVPLIGLLVIAAWGLPWNVRIFRRRPLPALAVVVLLVLGAVAHVQAAYWRDDEPLYRRALAVTSGNFVAHANLAWILERQGRLDEAQTEARAALAIDSKDARALVTLGNVAHRQQRRAEAESWYRKATASDPGSAKAWYNLGVVLHESGDLAQAVSCYRRALATAPGMASAHNNLAAALERLGQPDEALVHYREAARLDPANVEARTNRDRLTGRGR